MNWEPFVTCATGVRPYPPRSIHTKEGVGDRLRAAAFAELQAREAFRWGAAHFADAPPDLRKAWETLAEAEDRHLRLLLGRLAELQIDVRARPVSTVLWESLVGSANAKEFALFMAGSEERGRRAGERFRRDLAQADPRSAEIFGRIADEEVAHVALASRFFPSEGSDQKA